MSVRHILAGIGLLAIATTAVAAQASARDVELSFDFFSGGLHVLSLDSRSTLRGDRYVVEARLKTEGLADVLARFEATQRATGTLAALGARPARFEGRSSSRFGRREVVMRFGPDGSIEAAVEPPPEEDDRAPVPQQYRRGALDPLSALLVQVTDMDPARPCTETTAVFDGRRLYNLYFNYLGRETLARNRYAAYAGPVVKCRVDFERVKGFGAGEELRRKQREPIYVWLAQMDEQGLTVPVRLVTDTDWGSVVVHLTGYKFGQQRAGRDASAPAYRDD